MVGIHEVLCLKHAMRAGPAEPVGPVGPWPDQNLDKDSSRMRNQFDNWPP